MHKKGPTRDEAPYSIVFLTTEYEKLPRLYKEKFWMSRDKYEDIGKKSAYYMNCLAGHMCL